MRRSPCLTALAASAVLAFDAHAQTELEARLATSRYRYVDLSVATESGIVFDALYVGVPGLDQGWGGVGLALGSDAFSVVPMAFGVMTVGGTGGWALGTWFDASGGPWSLRGFVGRYVDGTRSSDSYYFADAIELAFGGRVAVGASATAFMDDAGHGWLAGPMLVVRDGSGDWRLAALLGDEREVRLGRTVRF